MRPSAHSISRRDLTRAGAIAFALLWAVVLALALFVIVSPVLAALGGVGLILTCALILLIGRHQDQLRALAQTDPLTGLTNHGGFHEELKLELENAGRASERVSLVMIDLDDFKAINDTHGHPYGDEILRGVGAQLRTVVREGDLAARVGGEEFALVLPRTGPEQAFKIAERARATVAQIPVHGMELSSSAGIAVYPADADDGSSLCQLADGALYWAKRAGKQRTRRFDPERVERTPTERQAEEVAAVLASPGGIRPVFQPVVSLPTGRLVGYEALARFPASPTRAPANWFAIAHRCGLGPALEAAAIRAALEPLGRPPGVHLAINVSPSVLLAGAVRDALPADLSEIVIEVTEHEALAEDEAVVEVLAELRERGALIAIDDAGAGYSGLKQLTQIQPDIVKLDRKLTEAIHTDPARMALIESFVRFARRTGAIVCAEGIEGLDAAVALADLDVEWGQGFALGRPDAPWGEVPAVAARVCRAGLAEALRPVPAAQQAIAAGDRGLERVSARLAAARTAQDLEGALPLLADELNADNVCLSQWHADDLTVETLAENGEPSGEPRFEIGAFPLTAKVLRDQEAVQVMVGDAEADPVEVELLYALGHRSMLMVPVVSRGESVGLIEAYCDTERAWTRTEINRARIISNQFASVIDAVFAGQAPGRPG